MLIFLSHQTYFRIWHLYFILIIYKAYLLNHLVPQPFNFRQLRLHLL